MLLAREVTQLAAELDAARSELEALRGDTSYTHLTTLSGRLAATQAELLGLQVRGGGGGGGVRVCVCDWGWCGYVWRRHCAAKGEGGGGGLLCGGSCVPYMCASGCCWCGRHPWVAATQAGVCYRGLQATGRQRCAGLTAFPCTSLTVLCRAALPDPFPHPHWTPPPLTKAPEPTPNPEPTSTPLNSLTATSLCPPNTP